jgi:DNA-binding transcriptional ArsR family regulator
MHKVFLICYALYNQSLMYAPDKNSLIGHLKALANPVRLRILEILVERDGEIGVNDLAAMLHMSQPRVSWHLALLRRGGLLRQSQAGRQRLCSLDWESIRHNQKLLWTLVSPRKKLHGQLSAASGPEFKAE